MNRYLLFLTLLSLPLSSISLNGADEILLDTIVAIVSTPESENQIITQSYLSQPSLDGQLRTKESIIDGILICEDGKKKYGISLNQDLGDRALQSIMEKNNLTLEQLKIIIEQAGYTLEKAKHELAHYAAVNSIIDFIITSRLIVSDDDVKEYYDQHPILEPASYVLQRAFVPISPYTSQEEHDKIYALLMNYYTNPIDDKNQLISWSTPFTITASMLDEEKRNFIDQLDEKHPVSQVSVIRDGFELFKLVEKRDERLVPLSSRYREIVEILRKPLYEKLLNEYLDDLKKSATIIYF